jgi:surface antigen
MLLVAAVVILVCALTPSGVYSQTGLRSFLGTAAAQMDEADWKLVREAALELLKDPQNASQSWSNTANQHHGTVSFVKSFDSADGRPCKRLRFDNVAGEVKGTAHYNVCRSMDGTWRLDS